MSWYLLDFNLGEIGDVSAGILYDLQKDFDRFLDEAFKMGNFINCISPRETPILKSLAKTRENKEAKK